MTTPIIQIAWSSSQKICAAGAIFFGFDRFTSSSGDVNRPVRCTRGRQVTTLEERSQSAAHVK